ncbi:MAG: hydrolase TatD [Proteobacteria bacterium]|nr:MAG: hydrolase TatD [Pseudomonadota bacterium]PIE40348.1 MAG: hydrolase TatD [Gammaproteobacteria bacterium]
MYIDSHCHLDRLNLKKYESDLSLALEAARSRGVDTMLNVAIDLENLEHLLAIADNYDFVYTSVGVHPSSNEGEDPTVERLVELTRHPKVIAIGETGLDYHYDEDKKAVQQSRFVNHLEAAKITRKPVIIHTRDAREDTISLMKQHADTALGGVMHCFTESLEMAEQALDLGFYISFSGIVTFKNAREIRDVVAGVPVDRILIETDSPYLAPVPYRGKPNEPAYVVEVAEQVAQIKNLPVEEVAEVTSTNFRRLFKLT